MDTPLSLLTRVQGQGNQEDWTRFCDLYYPKVLKWCRSISHSSHEAQDVAQEVFLEVYRKMATFSRQRKGSLRTWLRQILHSKALNMKGKRFPSLLDFTKLQESLAFSHDGSGDNLRYDEIMSQASAIVRKEFTPATWTIFERTHFNLEDPSQVAADMGLSVNSVYIARCRVMLSLKMQLCELLD